jgi:hypothetical protein
MPQFPRALPATLDHIVGPLIADLGPLAPAEHAARAMEAAAGISAFESSSVGLEVVLPPGPAACDLSVLLRPGMVPSFTTPAHEPARRFALAVGPDSGTVWWELDTSEPDPSLGVFLRMQAGLNPFDLAVQSAADAPGVAEAVEALRPVVASMRPGPFSLMGFFPDRRPLPVAAALVPTLRDDIVPTVRALLPMATASVDPDSAIVGQLLGTCGVFSVAVAADAAGRGAVSVEGSFRDRERAMAEGRWVRVLGDPEVWGEAGPSLSTLLALQHAHRFDALPPVGLLSGIDHIKVGPGGRVKAYVGALLNGHSIANR